MVIAICSWAYYADGIPNLLVITRMPEDRSKTFNNFKNLQSHIHLSAAAASFSTYCAMQYDNCWKNVPRDLTLCSGMSALIRKSLRSVVVVIVVVVVVAAAAAAVVVV
eukprot:9354219-Heterocapsa_arctica.AAC.1